jgi:hypothetical protein
MGVILGDIKLMKCAKTAQMGGFLKTSTVLVVSDVHEVFTARLLKLIVKVVVVENTAIN